MVNIRLINLTKKFGATAALNNLNLEVKDKEFLVLLGPSGCGKTTALRCIAGLETPDSGEIYIGDNLVNDIPPKDRDIAMVFQSYALYPHMTVYDNLAFPLKMRKMARQEIERRVKETAKLLGIDALLDRKPKQLSGGEAQRVALGRCIVRNPKVFLMDEPLSNLDAKLRLYMRAELKRLQKELETTTIYVTHDQAEAMTMGDSVAIMNQGTLQQLSTPDQAYNKPANLFVAGFLGSPPMNFVDCTFSSINGGILDSGTFQLALPKNLADAVRGKISDSEVVLGFRPEDVTLHDKPTPNAIKADVYVCEPLGSEIIVDLKLGENLIKVKTSSDTDVKIGETKYITLNKEKMHIFDKKTGKVLV
jgi:multiple sugar transport system ATP-binding protein